MRSRKFDAKAYIKENGLLERVDSYGNEVRKNYSNISREDILLQRRFKLNLNPFQGLAYSVPLGGLAGLITGEVADLNLVMSSVLGAVLLGSLSAYKVHSDRHLVSMIALNRKKRRLERGIDL